MLFSGPDLASTVQQLHQGLLLRWEAAIPVLEEVAVQLEPLLEESTAAAVAEGVAAVPTVLAVEAVSVELHLLEQRGRMDL